MNEILKLFFSLSVSASFIAAILFLVKPLYKDRLSRTWQYYIWFIVILRLLLPFSLQTNIVSDLFVKVNHYMIVQTKSVEILNNTSNMVTEGNVQDFQPEINTQNPQAEKQVNYLNDIISNLWLVWLGVAIMLFVRKITSFHGFVRYIKAGRYSVTDSDVLTIYDETCILAGINKSIGLYTNKLASSPMLVGFIKPFIVLPDMQNSKMELQNIFLHELTHFKRLDIFYKWLVQLAVCLHWFNPLVYFISREINKNCELSCDEMIIKKLDDKGKRSYGDTLLASLKFNDHYTDTIVSITLNEDARLLKERLGAIMKFKKSSKLTHVLSIVLAVFLLCGAAVTGAYASTTSIANSNQVFGLSSHFISADAGYYSNQFFTLDSDKMIQVSTKMTAKTGTLRFYIQTLGVGDYFSNGKVYDKYGKLATITVYDVSGSNVNDRKKIGLKAGQYLAAFSGTGKLKDVNFDLKGNIVDDAISSANQTVISVDEETPIVNDFTEFKELVPKEKTFEIKANGTLNVEISCKIGNINKNAAVGFTIYSPSNEEVMSGAGGIFEDSKEIKVYPGTWHYKISNGNLGINPPQPENGYYKIKATFTSANKDNGGSDKKDTNAMQVGNVGAFEFFRVENEEQLRAIGTGIYTLSDHYMLSNDITLTKEWIPIGNDATPFTGDFNGNGCTISNLKVTDKTIKYVGLFGLVKGGKVHNVNLRNVDTANAGGSIRFVSGIAAIVVDGGNVYDCTVTNDKKDKLDISNMTIPEDGLTKGNTVDTVALENMQYSGSWDIAELFIPSMSKGGIDQLVDLYNEKNATATLKVAADYYRMKDIGVDKRALEIMQNTGMWKYVEPLFPYMSNSGIDKVVAIYNQKHQTNTPKNASNYYNLVSKSSILNDDSEGDVSAVINLKNKNTYNISESGSFQAQHNQTLTLDITSNISGGTVDLFLFAPDGNEQRITISSKNLKKEITLSNGEWRYNCSGIFKNGGNIKIIGTID